MFHQPIPLYPKEDIYISDQTLESWGFLSEDKNPKKFISVDYIFGKKDQEPSIHDIRQSSSIGDCYFLSVLSAIVSQYPELINKIIYEDGKFVYVNLYMPKENNNYQLITYQLEKTICINKKEEKNGHQSPWVFLLEKAYCIHKIRILLMNHQHSYRDGLKAISEGNEKDVIEALLLGAGIDSIQLKDQYDSDIRKIFNLKLCSTMEYTRKEKNSLSKEELDYIDKDTNIEVLYETNCLWGCFHLPFDDKLIRETLENIFSSHRPYIIDFLEYMKNILFNGSERERKIFHEAVDFLNQNEMTDPNDFFDRLPQFPKHLKNTLFPHVWLEIQENKKFTGNYLEKNNHYKFLIEILKNGFLYTLFPYMSFELKPIQEQNTGTYSDKSKKIYTLIKEKLETNCLIFTSQKDDESTILKGIYSTHSYVVCGTYSDTNRIYIEITNPHGGNNALKKYNGRYLGIRFYKNTEKPRQIESYPGYVAMELNEFVRAFSSLEIVEMKQVYLYPETNEKQPQEKISLNYSNSR